MIMRVFSFLAMLTSFVFMIGLNVVLFEEEVMYGIGGIIGMIGFVIAYSISGDMILAPRDFWFQSSWGIFKKKIKKIENIFGERIYPTVKIECERKKTPAWVSFSLPKTIRFLQFHTRYRTYRDNRL